LILIPWPLLAVIAGAAEAASPEECCGLLAGRDLGGKDGGGAIVLTGAVPSANLAPGDKRRAFEIDPQVRFDAMRGLAGTGQRVAGVYHSHPGHGAEPSAKDLERAWEPELVWLITSVLGGRAVHTTAHVLAPDAGLFRRVPLRATDGAATPAPRPLLRA